MRWCIAIFSLSLLQGAAIPGVAAAVQSHAVPSPPKPILRIGTRGCGTSEVPTHGPSHDNVTLECQFPISRHESVIRTHVRA